MNRKERRATRPSAPKVAGVFAEAVEHYSKGEFELADGFCRTIVAADPRHAGSLHLLGAIALQRGLFDIAIAQIGKALAVDGRNAGYHNDIGLAFQSRGRLDDAIASFRRVISLDPHDGRGYANLAVALQVQGKNAEASEQYAKSLKSNSEVLSQYQDLCKTLCRLVPAVEVALARAGKHWPQRLSIDELFDAGGFIAAANDPLLHGMLVSTVVRSLDLERLLTSIRFALLRSATEGDAAAERSNLQIHCALARQCFINEYVFATTAEELAMAEQLKQSLDAALSAKADVSASVVAAVASYVPLQTVPNAQVLLDRAVYAAWPEALEAVLTLQLREPLEELALREKTTTLTPIEDETSQKVRRQYEENPYPRWVLPPPRQAVSSIDDFLRKQYPLVPLRNVANGASAEILIAGCGTGQHPIATAQLHAGARVLAIDLSLASLAYAQRKSRELGVNNITYAQADILKLGSIGRTFDFIDSAGVLHHLADPEAGWRVLLALLRPDGVMRVGLYSETARRDIVAARAFIAERGYRPTAEDIRIARAALLETPLGAVARYNDFYSASECRDMLFHVQEHRFTIARIREFLEENGLRFIGFQVGKDVVVEYGRRFPNDRAMRDLKCWEQFEAEQPNTFKTMYQFWMARR